MKSIHWKSMLIVLMAWAILYLTGRHLSASAQGGGFLYTEGNRILDASGNHVIITGISWFGLETENYAPHGLWARSLDSFLDQIVELGFNTIRLPFSSQLFDTTSVPNGINYDLNPDLEGLSGIEIMDQIIAGAGDRGLKVILDRHRPDSRAQSELWYTAQYSEGRWISDWVMLAERYSGDDTVIGADLHNEPHGSATWGTGDQATDWELAAERAGNAILEVNSNWLIIVQGVEQYQGEYYWWGGNLMGVHDHPVDLNLPEKLVYSPHTYGPGVYPQTWFSDPAFPDNMPGIWDSHWGFVHKEGLAPVILGEFGGRSVENDREGIWQRALVTYLHENEISYLYWTLNPNSGDTGGILLDDWQTVDPNKQALLSSYLFPMIGSNRGRTEPGQVKTPATVGPASAQTPTSEPAPSATSVLLAATRPTTGKPTGLRLRYRTSNPAEMSSDAKPELIIANDGSQAVALEDLEIIYWFTDDPGQSHSFYCDWAQMGCERVLGEFETLGNGGFALHIRFSPNSGEVLPGQESGEIKVRFNRVDWTGFNQADDYSFSGETAYADWESVTLYQEGALVWGRPPGQQVEAANSTASPAMENQVPPTVLSPIETVRSPAEENLSASPSQTAEGPAAPASRPVLGTWIASLLAAAVLGFTIAVVWLVRRKSR